MKQVASEQDRHRDRAQGSSESSSNHEQEPAERRRGARGGKGGAGDRGDGVGGLFSGAINAGLHGAALPDALRARFEASLGVPLHGVRIHTDAAAARAAEQVNADAFAQGQDIYFATGRYRPGTPDGDQLIAHEVAHTVQQRGGSASGQMTEPGDAVEHSADAAALAMTSGGSASIEGGAPQTIARQVRGATPPAAGEPTIAQRFPQGITVALALQARDPAEHAPHLVGQNLGALVRRADPQLATNRGTIRGWAANHGDQPTTADEARAIAQSLHDNDMAFIHSAEPFASAHRAVGNPEAPAVGQPILFSQTARSQNAYARVNQLSTNVGPLPSPDARHPNANIRNLAIFTHGWSSGVNLGAGAPSSAGEFVSRLSGLLTPDVNVQLYACSAAKEGANHAPSFGENVTTGLARDGHNTRVFGHTTDGPTATNTNGRTFEAQAGIAAGVRATAHHNSELIFTSEFRTEQIAAIARQLAVPEADVARVFGPASRLWMHGRSADERHHITGITAALHRGHADGSNLAISIGTDPAATVAAAQTMWRAEGAAFIANVLHVRAPDPGATAPHVDSVPAAARDDAAVAREEVHAAAAATPAAQGRQSQFADSPRRHPIG